MALLTDVRYTVAVTAASSVSTTQLGGIQVALQLDLQHPSALPIPATLTGHEGPASMTLAQRPGQQSVNEAGIETVQLDLTIPQFYQLLTTLEEAKAALSSAAEK